MVSGCFDDTNLQNAPFGNESLVSGNLLVDF